MNQFKMLCAALAILLLSVPLAAQITNKYAFTAGNTVWELLSGTAVTDAMTEDGLSYAIDIGFAFPYGENTYTQVKISSNGWLGLGANLNNSYYANDLATLNIRPLVAPLWDDLDMSYGLVQHLTSGEAPHRVFQVQWLAARWNRNATEGEFHFMARLHETGQVDIIYGPHNGTPNNPSSSIGMNMAPGGPGWYYSILPGEPPMAFSTNQYQNITTVHPSGAMYIFMPKTLLTANPACLNLTGTRTPMQSVSADYTAVIGNAGTSIIPSGQATVRLLREGEILSSAAVPQLIPGGFAAVNLPWAPDTTGLMHLTAQVELAGDPDSLNNASYAFMVTAIPFVGNQDETQTPLALSLSAYPNPFGERIVLQFDLEKAEQVSLRIYDIKGRLVRDLLKEFGSEFMPGKSTAKEWDGLDERGYPVANGIYLCRLSANNYSTTKKIIRLK